MPNGVDATTLVVWFLAGLGAWLVVAGVGAAPRRDGRPRWGALATWIALTGNVQGVLGSILGAGASALAILLALRAPGGPVNYPADQLGSFAAGTAVSAVAMLIALLLAAWFLRRLDWSAIAESTGWQFGPASRLVLAIAASSWLAWPMTLVFMVQMAAPAAADAGVTASQTALYGLPTWIWGPLLQSTVALLATVVALWPAWRLSGIWIERGRNRPPAWLAGTRAERALLAVGLAGLLTLGLTQAWNQVVAAVSAYLGAMGPLTYAALSDWRLPAAWSVATLATLLLLAWLLLSRFPWARLDDLTGWSLSAWGRGALALSFAALLVWPLGLLEWLQYALAVPDSLPPWLWPALAVAFLAGAVAWLQRYRPPVDLS